MSNWINTNDQKPQQNQNIIAVGMWWGEVSGYGEDGYMGIGRWNADKGHVEVDSDKYATHIRQVYYWMPLPEWPEL